MKKFTLRDFASILLALSLICALMVVVTALENYPIHVSVWIAFGASVILWCIYVVSVVDERRKLAKAPKLKIYRDGRWVDVNTLKIEQDNSPSRKPFAELFDQDNYKEQA